MKTMILAAGRGQRMRPLTDHTPKPLLPVGGQPLIVWHIKRLANAGLRDIVINHAWLGEKIEGTLGDGSQWGVSIRYSPEPTALETAGGIANALPLLGQAPFLVINGDTWCDWPVQNASTDDLRPPLSATTSLAHLVLVPNPTHHPEGDFAIDDGGKLSDSGNARLTYSGLGIYHPDLFKAIGTQEPAALGPILKQAMTKGLITGEVHRGQWMDIGTPQRLEQLDKQLSS